MCLEVTLGKTLPTISKGNRFDIKFISVNSYLWQHYQSIILWIFIGNIRFQLQDTFIDQHSTSKFPK